MPMVIGSDQLEQVRKVREWLAAYDDVSDLVSIGAYKDGSNPIADEAIARNEDLNGFLRQDKAQGSTWDETMSQLERVTG